MTENPHRSHGRSHRDLPEGLPGHVREHVGDVSGTVVVGVDGSECGRKALRFAAEEARARGCALVALRAWSLPTAPRPTSVEPGVVPAMTEFEQAVADEIMAEVREELGADPGIEVIPMPVHHHAGPAIIEATRTAVLVVVGHRGHSGVTTLFLGSVSEHTVRHAEGPVAVIR